MVTLFNLLVYIRLRFFYRGSRFDGQSKRQTNELNKEIKKNMFAHSAPDSNRHRGQIIWYFLRNAKRTAF